MSNIRSAFAGKKAFIPFITCGDPTLDATVEIVRAAAENGADLIELGIPFSDPTAEGPVIQGANIRALEGGATTDKIFDMVRRLRKAVTVPMVFVTYANVVFSYGAERFISICGRIGIDGLVIPDIPYEEKDEFQPICTKHGVDLISTVAPTSAKRIGMISREAEGFIYIACSPDATDTNTDLKEIVDEIRKNTDIPCAVSYGITEPEQAAEMAEITDGVMAEAAIIEIIEKHGESAAAPVAGYVRKMKAAVM